MAEAEYIEDETPAPDEADAPVTEESPDEELPQAAESEEEQGEVEVVLEDDATSEEPTVPVSVMQRRLARQKASIERRLGGESEESEPLPAAPTLDQFDYNEDQFSAAQAKYQADIVERAATKAVQQHLGATQAEAQKRQQDQERGKALDSHYNRAEKLRVPDYEVAEDAAIELMGDTLVGEIARKVDNSEMVLYHLGKNPAKAAALAQQVQSDPVAGMIAVGKLAASLTARPKTSTPPPPADEVEGATPGTPTALQKAFDKELSKPDPDYRAIRKMRVKAREGGIELE